MASLAYIKTLKRWRVRYQARKRGSKKVFRGSKVFLEKAQALEYYLEVEKQEKLVRSGQVEPSQSLIEAVDRYYQHYRKFTSRTQEHYKYVMDKFLASLPASIVRIHQLKDFHIREYLYRMMDRNCTNRTQNANLTVIKSFCRYYAGLFGIDNPALKVKMLAEEPPNARFISEIEYSKILEAANPIAKNRIIFLANTGLRAAEFANLNSSSVNPTLTAITITGKGRKRRTVPLNQTAKAIWPELSICTKNALELQFQRIARRIEIPLFGPHALRHYFATQLLLKGVSMVYVSKLLGHSSVRTTEQCYAHILPEHLANVTDVLD